MKNYNENLTCENLKQVHFALYTFKDKTVPNLHLLSIVPSLTKPEKSAIFIKYFPRLLILLI